jgi:hypothetical protein
MTAHAVFKLAAAVVVTAMLLCLPAGARGAMIAPWWAYALLAVFGMALVNVFVWSLCAIASETDEQMEREAEGDE